MITSWDLFARSIVEHRCRRYGLSVTLIVCINFEGRKKAARQRYVIWQLETGVASDARLK